MASVLVLGGTSWVGGAVAAHALSLGHEVTCLARGESGRAPEGTTWVRADRSDPAAYEALPRDIRWDLVVDVARQPGHVRGAVRALADRTTSWAFVSSCSVYARHDEPGADESAELLPALESDTATPEQYGEGKVACEQAVAEGRGGDALVARSGLIVGHGDPSERSGYWPGRFSQAARDGGPVLVPDHPAQPVQWVDVRDLTAWLIQAGLRGTTGRYNAVGAALSLTEVLDTAAQVAGFDGEVVRAGSTALAQQDVRDFMGPRSLPLWLADPAWQSFMDRSGAAAARAGLETRSLEETMAAALAWETELGTSRPRARAGLARAEELAVIRSLSGSSAVHGG
ncbi:NAD-dependent epimerase/dehydratase family protein [Intrasporangium calvum]|uniref:NAD-dependent epimerase/dehydratase family protein n=1 Tax=Intrasporangium calvum TaxID=53358 RepID=A0ABT5GGR7_9MICO|nr:NAD-dependent epimerase/dehydratase family protein [Intrasporangium calvum]MDC5697448.1 NAD-dependent epimerase/dehydratase family protein [Intrasporangium calvum]